MQLLGGLTATQFLNEYWQKKPCLIRNAYTNFPELIDFARLSTLAQQDDVESRLIEYRQQRWHLEHGPFLPPSLPLNLNISLSTSIFSLSYSRSRSPSLFLPSPTASSFLISSPGLCEDLQLGIRVQGPSLRTSPGQTKETLYNDLRSHRLGELVL